MPKKTQKIKIPELITEEWFAKQTPTTLAQVLAQAMQERAKEREEENLFYKPINTPKSYLN